MLVLWLACAAAPDLASPATSSRGPSAPADTTHHAERGASHARKAKTRTVDCNGAGEYLDIDTAIRDAHSGDTIEVAPCTYTGQVNFLGRAVHIIATGGPSVTTIVGTPGESVVYAHRGEGPGTILEGFTITGGGGDLVPAIEEQFSSLVLKNDIITGNAGNITIYARSALLTLDGVTVDGTNTASEGMVIQGRRGQIVVKDSSITCGAVGMGYMMEHGAAFLDGAEFHCAGATAAQIFHSSGRVQRSSFEGLLHVENEGTDGEPTVVEGSILYGGASVIVSALQLKNSIVSGGGIVLSSGVATLINSVVTRAECGITHSRSSLSTSYTNFWQNTLNVCGGTDPVGSNGNIAVDPVFVDASARDFHLVAGSPLIDAGSTGAEYPDVDGSRNDIGVFGGPFTMDGGW